MTEATSNALTAAQATVADQAKTLAGALERIEKLEKQPVGGGPMRGAVMQVSFTNLDSVAGSLSTLSLYASSTDFSIMPAVVLPDTITRASRELRNPSSRGA